MASRYDLVRTLPELCGKRCGSIYDTLAILEDASRRISDAVGALMLASRADQQHGPRQAGEFEGILEQTADSLGELNLGLYSAAKFLESLRATDDMGAEAAPSASTRRAETPVASSQGDSGESPMFDVQRAAFGPDAGLIISAREIVRLQEQIDELLSDQNPEIDDDAREAAAAPFKEKQEALLDQLIETKTATLDGIFARARVWEAYAMPLDIRGASGYEGKMIFRLVSDLLNLSKMSGAPGVGAAPAAGPGLSEARQFAIGREASSVLTGLKALHDLGSFEDESVVEAIRVRWFAERLADQVSAISKYLDRCEPEPGVSEMEEA